jgi:hypothetical protein
MRKIYIWDLDGTLANIDERMEYARKPNGKINYKKLYDRSMISTDKPIKEMVDRYKELKAQGHRMMLFTGRCISTIKETVDWLEENGVTGYEILMMRPSKPPEAYTPAPLLKKIWFHEELDLYDRSNVIGSYDDNKKVIDMWKELGIPTFHVGIDETFI